MGTTIPYVFWIAFRPARTTEKLLTDSARLRHAVTAWMAISLIYGAVAFVGGLRGFGAMVEPFLPLSAKEYYLWMAPLTPLIYLLNFLLFAGLVQLF